MEKKPKTAFEFFRDATKRELASADVDLETLNTLCRDEWRTLSDEAKAPYEFQHRMEKGVSAHFHSNICPSGKVFIPLCDNNAVHWDASWTIPEVLLSLLVMLHRNNNSDPACEDPYRAWRNVDGATNYHLNRRDYKACSGSGQSGRDLIGSASALMRPRRRRLRRRSSMLSSQIAFAPLVTGRSEAVKPVCVSRGERGGVLRVWGTEYFYERATNIGDVVDGSIVPDWNASRAESAARRFRSVTDWVQGNVLRSDPTVHLIKAKASDNVVRPLHHLRPVLHAVPPRLDVV